MSEKFIRRYTDITSLIEILTTKELTLLNPESWDDKNDSHFIDLYKEKKKLKKVLALCFSQSIPNYHHWSVFANGPSGVCISFRKDGIVDAIKNLGSLQLREVKYLTLNEIRSDGVRIDELPFVKRAPFKPENEIRMIWESAKDDFVDVRVKIDLELIDRIYVSPWLHESLVDPVKKLLKSIDGCKNLEIYKSTIVSNAEWKKIGEGASDTAKKKGNI